MSADGKSAPAPAPAAANGAGAAPAASIAAPAAADPNGAAGGAAAAAKKKKKKKKPAAAVGAATPAAAPTVAAAGAGASAAAGAAVGAAAGAGAGAAAGGAAKKQTPKEREVEREAEKKKKREADVEAKLQRDSKSLAAASQSGATDKDTSELLRVVYGLKDGNSKKQKKDGKDDKSYEFWNTQPVPKLSEKTSEHGPIENKKLDEVMKEPYPLPGGYEWCSCDMNDEKTVNEVYKLLSENYVEDDDNMFRFDYSRDFLKWALKPPGFRQDWHIGVRSTKKKELLAFITGIPANIRVYNREMKMVEINFLCVHKLLRSKRLAPVLIKEVTRRVNMQNIWQAVYTAGVMLPKPVAQNRYYHRSLNPKKLIDIGFSRLQPRMTLARTIKLYKLPNEPVTKGMRAMEAKDVPEACQLLVNYLKQFHLAQVYNADEFAHWLMPRDGVIYTYVVEDVTSKKLTDLVSFYALPSSIIGNKEHHLLKAAYSFYNVPNKTDIQQLMTDALIMARKMDFDVFNALNVMENDKFLKDLKFGIGDGHLQYYLYNWRCPEMQPKDVGLVLL